MAKKTVSIVISSSMMLSFCACVCVLGLWMLRSGATCRFMGFGCTAAPQPTMPLNDTSSTQWSATGELAKYTKKPNKTVDGFDLSAWSRAKSVTDCATACSRNTACTQFVVSDKTKDGYQCWLKRGGALKPSTNRATYVRRIRRPQKSGGSKLPSTTKFTAIDKLGLVGAVVGESSWSSSEACAAACTRTASCAWYEQRKKDGKCVLKSGDWPSGCSNMQNPSTLCMDVEDQDVTTYVPDQYANIAQEVATANSKIVSATNCDSKCKANDAFNIISAVFGVAGLVAGAGAGLFSSLFSLLDLTTTFTSIGLNVAANKDAAAKAANAMTRWRSRRDNSFLAYSNFDLLGQYDAWCGVNNTNPAVYGGKNAVPIPQAKVIAQCAGNTNGLKNGLRINCSNSYTDQYKAKTATTNDDITSGVTSCGINWGGAVFFPSETNCPRTSYGYYNTWFKRPCERYNCSDDFKDRMNKMGKLFASASYADHVKDTKLNRSGFARPTCDDKLG